MYVDVNTFAKEYYLFSTYICKRMFPDGMNRELLFAGLSLPPLGGCERKD
jgi:hypothetical protein